MPYSYDWKIRFGEVDRAGIVYYPVLFLQLHHAVEDLFEDAGFPLHELHDAQMGMPIVHAEADYYRPMTYGNTVRIDVVPEMGDSSVTFQLTGSLDGERTFEAQEKHVFVDMETFESTPIPDDLRDGFARYASPRS